MEKKKRDIVVKIKFSDNTIKKILIAVSVIAPLALLGIFIDSIFLFFAVFAICPLMHLFMGHGGHGRHEHEEASEGEGKIKKISNI